MKQEAGQFPSSCVHEVAESKGFRALEEYLERVCTYAVCVVRCCVLGEITLNVRCPQLSDSRFGAIATLKQQGGSVEMSRNPKLHIVNQIESDALDTLY